MKSREFKKIYHPSLGRYVYEHRGNGLIVDNIMKPLKGVKGAFSTAANKAGRAVARAIGKKASKTAKAAAEKSGDLIRRRLQNQVETPKSRGRKAKSSPSPSARVTEPRMSNNDVNWGGERGLVVGRWTCNPEVPGSNPRPCHWMDLSSVAPNSTPPRCVNSQLVSLPPVGILNLLCLICIIFVCYAHLNIFI